MVLPAAAAGRLVPGDEARVILDTLPETVLPMTVPFVSPDARFTPKTVKPDAERDRLMFRIELAPRLILAKGWVATDRHSGNPWPRQDGTFVGWIVSPGGRLASRSLLELKATLFGLKEFPVPGGRAITDKTLKRSNKFG